MMRRAWLAMAIMVVAAPVQADDFGAVWHDGKAELDGYRLKVSRYGEERDGTAVMIFVTEPFSESKRVKVDDHTKNPSDVVDAFKLNLVRDFQTGIYDYNTMTSLFVRSADFSVLKSTFSSAEWCGHVYSEMVFRRGIEGFYASYFENESRDIRLDIPAGGITEESLFILLRSLRGEFLAAGGSKTLPFLPSAYASRLMHRAPEWTRATIKRGKSPTTVTVPAGAFECVRYDVAIEDGRNGVFWVEGATPHRIVRWELVPDVSGELAGTARLEYWKLHGNGDEKYLEQLGLGARR